MPKSKWIDKKTAQTFTLVHRSQNDPLINDADASQMVFKEIATPNVPLDLPPQQPSYSKYRGSSSSTSNFSSAASSISVRSGTSKIKNISDLESEYGFKSRANEGEAALYGVYYDDTEYDYMQHMREIGVSSEAVFIEAPQAQSKQRKGKGPATIPEEEEEERNKGKMTLDELLEEDTNAKNGGKTQKVQLPADVLPSGGYVKRNYQDQQDVPDAIAGFQPDLDPRLREVLQALEDEAYVEDDGEEDFFGTIAKSGQVEEFEFERSADFFDEEEEDAGWESDVTEKGQQVSSTLVAQKQIPVGELPDPEMVGADETALESAEVNEDWQREFAKFKKDKKKTQFKDEGLSSVGGKTTSTAMSFGADDLASLVSSFNNRKLKKKGVPSSARTSMSSSYSMSSSALFRTEGLTTLDDRFDRIEEEYARDEEEEDMMSQSSVLSNAPERQDFGNILDEFLDSYSTTGKRHQRVRRGKQQTGMEQLDEIRQGLGKPRLRAR
ncbi:hypothetical protein H072_3398 [Dactylellina haptotyla CBS 200.50]|uniref:Low temperature viability protein n=1 Tax=Dactylellina haptotyla (strain CBS 200.50) TaxID=1284197 RepID=S8ANA0_DACHA|nr:hypothetical protein H072_3398 [Dactylellina haptotyla CBS 200.50]